ncbi:hypothetical protein [Streptomyces sp. NPDC058613]|uniref:hypothetical protein n=1 Tax=Streptomyces sp. NPDC058613 TaxID=3346556 RepID=UPI00364DFF06
MANTLVLNPATLLSDGSVEVSLTYSCTASSGFSLGLGGTTSNGKRSDDVTVAMTRDGKTHDATVLLKPSGGAILGSQPFAKGDELWIQASISKPMSTESLIEAEHTKTFTL